MLSRDIKPNKFPDICITSEVYRKIKAYADLCENEISALGSVKVVDNMILIDDIFLFEQVVTGTSTELSSKAISQFICDYIKNGKDPSTLKFWWHSHVNMGVFWSGTDTSTIDRFSSDWMISMVSNKRNEFKIRVDIFSPFRMYMDDLPLNIDYDKSFNANIKREIDVKVKHEYLPMLRDMLSPALVKYPSSNTQPVLPYPHQQVVATLQNKNGISNDSVAALEQNETFKPVKKPFNTVDLEYSPTLSRPKTWFEKWFSFGSPVSPTHQPENQPMGNSYKQHIKTTVDDLSQSPSLSDVVDMLPKYQSENVPQPVTKTWFQRWFW